MMKIKKKIIMIECDIIFNIFNVAELKLSYITEYVLIAFKCR